MTAMCRFHVKAFLAHGFSSATNTPRPRAEISLRAADDSRTVFSFRIFIVFPLPLKNTLSRAWRQIGKARDRYV
jgi:hypothetical protein